jgi:hypothetical protein
MDTAGWAAIAAWAGFAPTAAAALYARSQARSECRLCREPAENIAESLSKGAWVIAAGRFQQRSCEDRGVSTGR